MSVAVTLLLLELCPSHCSYLSRPPRPAVVNFFQASAPFSIENAKFWLFCHEFMHFLAWIMWWCPKIDKYEVWPLFQNQPNPRIWPENMLIALIPVIPWQHVMVLQNDSNYGERLQNVYLAWMWPHRFQTVTVEQMSLSSHLRLWPSHIHII